MRIKNDWFTDDRGRRLLLRGVNLGGSSKVPKHPGGATHLSEHFFEHRDVSFFGRPFPLNEADEHFTRLRHWGFNFVRFLVTWEAIEHTGPGQYDVEYLDYLSAVLEKAGEYGISLFIDPHQDVWSRFSGGDGAPGWTLEAIGFELRNFQETGAAITHQTHGDPYPWFIWPSNGDKLACATMFTLFFAGNDFAPQTLVDGELAQDYLQRHYIAAIQQVANRTRNMSHVVGYDTLNEPDLGWIGLSDITKSASFRRNGLSPSPWQSILIGSGYPQEVDIWKFGSRLRASGRQWLNQQRVKAWKDGRKCVWRANGVWDIDPQGEPRLIRPDHFASANGRPVNFSEDYFCPFANRYARAIRAVHPEAIIFIDPSPLKDDLSWGHDDAQNVVYAPHWYDVITLVFKTFKPWISIDTRNLRLVWSPLLVRRSLANQLRHFKLRANNQLGGLPVHLGETGIPFDMNKARAYRTRDFSVQERALDRCLRAVEDNLMNVTIWNYTADNTNARGDQWNGEDFSVFSRDQQTNGSDMNSGGRALAALLRPYPKATAGKPAELSYDMKKRIFKFKYQHDSEMQAPTEIFVPSYNYPSGYKVIVSDGKWEKDTCSQTLTYWHTTSQNLHQIKISPES